MGNFVLASRDMKKRAHLRKDPRDFTGGAIMGLPGRPGTTGDKDIDEQIKVLVEGCCSAAVSPLVREMMVTALKMGRDGIGQGDMKLYSRALKEMRRASLVFGPYEDERKLSIFGSARTQPDEPEFRAAVAFAGKMREAGFMSITGAGPGIMEAAQEGSGRDGSFGLNIKLPFEQGANPTILGDEKLIHFNYFFTRKLAFVKESDAIAAFPGGFGTMDELFEVMTLIQTGKAQVVPIVLIDAKGGTYWKTWFRFVQDHLLRLGLISEDDFHLFKVTDDLDEAVEEIAAGHDVVLITKGDLFHQEAKVRQSGLAQLFPRIEIVSEKDPQTYARVLEEFDLAPKQFLMIGNSLRSDVAPVLALGGWAVHMPYHLTWEHEREADLGDHAWRMREVAEPAGLPAAVREIAAAAGTAAA